MQSRPTPGILARLRAMLPGSKPAAEAKPPAASVPQPAEPTPGPAPVAAAQPPAKDG